jgi:16S rRNA U516 pseudouridylate synthase RsuA-like enzyme
MFERIKHPVLSLKRVRIGKLYLGDLDEGEIRKLKPSDIKALLKS